MRMNETPNEGEYIYFDIPEVTSFLVEKYDGPNASKSHPLIVWAGGCGIGYASDTQDAYRIIREYAEKKLTNRKRELADELYKIDAMLSKSALPDWIQLFRKEFLSSWIK